MRMKTQKGLATDANWAPEVKELALVMKTPHLHAGGVGGGRKKAVSMWWQVVGVPRPAPQPLADEPALVLRPAP